MTNLYRNIIFIITIVLSFALSQDAVAQKVKLKINSADFEVPANYKQAKKNAKKGLKHYKKGKVGDYREAAKYFNAAYEFDPNNAALNYYLGSSYLASTNKKRCLQHFEIAHKQNPNIAKDILFKLARGYHLNYKFEKAREYYLKYRATLDTKELLRLTPVIQKYVQETEYGEKYVKEPQRVFIDNIGDNVNTAFSEYSPVVSIDGRTLYFTSQRPIVGKKKTPKYKSTQNYYEKIYKTTKEKGVWTEPEQLPKPVNSKANNAVVGISPSGQELILFDGKDRNGDLSITKTKSKARWSKPSKRPFGKINSKHRETSASMHLMVKQCGLHLTTLKLQKVVVIFTNHAELISKNWETIESRNLVNSPYDEEAVFISPDGQTLYFSSNGHTSMGGFDIFKCEIERDGTWGVPQNLGHPINTPDDDMFFSITANQRFGYYASQGQDSSNGAWDIYMITFLGPEKPLIQNSEDMLLASLANPITETVIEKTVEIKTIRLTIVKGVISDSFTERPIGATFEVVDNEKYEIVQTVEGNPETGEYMITLPSGRNYAMMVKATDYLHHSENFNIPAATNYRNYKNIMLNKLEVGSKVV